MNRVPEDTAPSPGGSSPADEAPSGPVPADRWILAAFGVYAVLLLLAAWAQVSDNRTLLDLFDLKRFFTK